MMTEEEARKLQEALDFAKEQMELYEELKRQNLIIVYTGSDYVRLSNGLVFFTLQSPFLDGNAIGQKLTEEQEARLKEITDGITKFIEKHKNKHE